MCVFPAFSCLSALVDTRASAMCLPVSPFLFVQRRRQQMLVNILRSPSPAIVSAADRQHRQDREHYAMLYPYLFVLLLRRLAPIFVKTPTDETVALNVD